MSREVFEIVQTMDLKDVETQLAIQCAPLITGLKPSNLLIIPNANLVKVKQILKNSNISYFLLLVQEQKTTLLLYSKQQLEAWLSEKRTIFFLRKMGYQKASLCEVLPVFQMRYQKYMSDSLDFPHEIGILLGYPLGDVEGFIQNSGKNYLYTGYWKVYENLAEKLKLFNRFEIARKTLLQLVSRGVSMVDIIDRYSTKALQEEAV